MDTIEQMLSALLDGAVDTLDIAPSVQQRTIACYEDVGSWLVEHGNAGWRIYPQGSFRLGTVVRPNTPAGDYDIDLVCLLPIAKDSTTQAELKERIGDQLAAYMFWKRQQAQADGPSTCDARRRCWTLGYPAYGFHLDVLPTIADAEYPPTGILLTDVQLREWQHSNPIGYSTWFRSRSEELQQLLFKVATERHVDVAEVPVWEFRSTLQRVVQVLKWHCMLRFADEPDNRPPSILITTLAALAYAGERDLFIAARNVLNKMAAFIENRDGKWWVANPAHEGENFADKWNEYPDRREAFLAWHTDITTVLNDLARLDGTGLRSVVSRMSGGFDPDAVLRSAERYGERLHQQRETGALRMGPTGLITTTAASGPILRNHTFHGQHPNPRD